MKKKCNGKKQAALYKAVEDFFGINLVDEKTMIERDKSCLVPTDAPLRRKNKTITSPQ